MKGKVHHISRTYTELSVKVSGLTIRFNESDGLTSKALEELEEGDEIEIYAYNVKGREKYSLTPQNSSWVEAVSRKARNPFDGVAYYFLYTREATLTSKGSWELIPKQLEEFVKDRNLIWLPNLPDCYTYQGVMGKMIGQYFKAFEEGEDPLSHI